MPYVFEANALKQKLDEKLAEIKSIDSFIELRTKKQKSIYITVVSSFNIFKNSHWEQSPWKIPGKDLGFQ